MSEFRWDAFGIGVVGILIIGAGAFVAADNKLLPIFPFFSILVGAITGHRIYVRYADADPLADAISITRSQD
ncbi:MAG: hypothetical protein ABEI86_06060 [Halobacteriaceae archaeon]